MNSTPEVTHRADWKPIHWSRDVTPNSALDFSFLLDGPAGKYGRLITNKNHFVFADRPDRAQRFYGVNLCGQANFPDRETCHQLVDRLAACGYNSVRFHHHDQTLTVATGERGVQLDPPQADKLDYLFHCLKQRGIYLTTDLFVSRRPKQIFSELGRPIANFEEFKFLIYLLEDAYQNWEDYARNFLTHVNPYTGLAWKDDPALVTLNCVNEGAIFHCYRAASPDVRRLYDSHFEAWLSNPTQDTLTGHDRTALLNRFLVETCSRTVKRMRKFIDSLGCRTLITDQNHWSILPMSILRQDCDFVHDHFYWDHPEHFPLPSKLLNESSLTDLHSIYSGIVPGRLFDRPYTVSEYNWVYPNQHRGEGAPMTAAYAALQDWAGLYRFDYLSQPANEEARGGYFAIAADPINSLSDRIGVLFFLRGDVQPSSLHIPFAVSSKHMLAPNPVNTYPGQAWKLGFVGQIGTVVERAGELPLPANAKLYIDQNDGLVVKSAVPAVGQMSDEARLERIQQLASFGEGMLDLTGKTARSSTGEISIDEPARTFTVATARSEVLVFCAASKLAGRVLSAENESGPAVIFAAAVDHESLVTSKRILLMHLTDVVHHDLKFNANVIEQWGTPPHLVRQGRTKVMLHGVSSSLRAWALDLTGKRICEMGLTRMQDGSIELMLDTHAEHTPCLLYELACS